MINTIVPISICGVRFPPCRNHCTLQRVIGPSVPHLTKNIPIMRYDGEGTINLIKILYRYIMGEIVANRGRAGLIIKMQHIVTRSSPRFYIQHYVKHPIVTRWNILITDHTKYDPCSRPTTIRITSWSKHKR